MSKAWGRGSTTAWRKTRMAVLLRDGYQCRAHTGGWCDRVPRNRTHVCTQKAEQVHHTIGKRYGDNPAYLVASCRACNLHIGDPTRHGNPPCRPMTLW